MLFNRPFAEWLQGPVNWVNCFKFATSKTKESLGGYLDSQHGQPAVPFHNDHFFGACIVAAGGEIIVEPKIMFDPWSESADDRLVKLLDSAVSIHHMSERQIMLLTNVSRGT